MAGGCGGGMRVRHETTIPPARLKRNSRFKMSAEWARWVTALHLLGSRRFQRNLDLHRGHTDVAGVKTNTLGRILSAFAVGMALLGCPAFSHASTPVAADVVPIGNNTFSITRKATNAFSRDTDKLKAAVQQDAAQYCAAQGKQLKVVDLTAEKPFFSTGYASATIVFKALNPGEVEQLNSAPAALENGERPGGTGDLYNDLLKLDDLRKKGILTDEEFQAEKKKVLNRSK
jgi:hypothetical protein